MHKTKHINLNFFKKLRLSTKDRSDI